MDIENLKATQNIAENTTVLVEHEGKVVMFIRHKSEAQYLGQYMVFPADCVRHSNGQKVAELTDHDSFAEAKQRVIDSIH